MAVAKVVLGCLLSAALCAASHPLLELNPDLSPFQDEREDIIIVGQLPRALKHEMFTASGECNVFLIKSRKCFPAKETFYLVYRDFEEDPYLGGKSKCVSGTMTGVFANDSTYMYFEYPGSKGLTTRMKLMSFPGYTAKNILNFTPLSAPDKSFNLTIAYRDCNSCKVARHSYIKNGLGCSMWVAHHERHIPHPCCDYVFELLCGFNPTYQMFDESCL